MGSRHQKGKRAEANLKKQVRAHGFESHLSPASKGNDIRIKTKTFGWLKGEVKAKGGNGFNFDYKGLHQAAANSLLAKRQVGQHTKFGTTMPYLISMKFDFFIQLLKLVEELAELKKSDMNN